MSIKVMHDRTLRVLKQNAERRRLSNEINSSLHFALKKKNNLSMFHLIIMHITMLRMVIYIFIVLIRLKAIYLVILKTYIHRYM